VGLTAQAMFGFEPVSDDSIQTLYEIFRAFSDCLYFVKETEPTDLILSGIFAAATC
jgi:hypothetical protein